MNKFENRYYNTALLMQEALVTLLNNNKDFEYITIKELCHKAGVNRSTFYLHYQNMNELLNEIIDSLHLSFISHFNASENYQAITSKENINDLYLITDTYLIPYLKFVKENKNIYRALKNNPVLFNVHHTYQKMFDSIFSPILTRYGSDKKWHTYIMDYYMHGCSQIILNWIRDDCIYSEIEICELIKGLVNQNGK